MQNSNIASSLREQIRLQERLNQIAEVARKRAQNANVGRGTVQAQGFGGGGLSPNAENLQFATGGAVSSIQPLLQQLNDMDFSTVEQAMRVLGEFRDMIKMLPQEMQPAYEQMAAQFETFINKVDGFNKVLEQGIENALMGLGDSIGQALAGAERPFDAFLSTIANFAGQLGRYLIGIGIGIETFKTSL